MSIVPNIQELEMSKKVYLKLMVHKDETFKCHSCKECEWVEKMEVYLTLGIYYLKMVLLLLYSLILSWKIY